MSETMTVTIPKTAALWLREGERGVSSETIWTHLSGLNIRYRNWKDTPSDPADLRRCRLLLEAVPEWRERLPEMVTVSKKWEVLVSHWDELCALFDSECPNWRGWNWSAKRTYDRMKEIGL